MVPGGRSSTNVEGKVQLKKNPPHKVVLSLESDEVFISKIYHTNHQAHLFIFMTNIHGEMIRIRK